MGAGHRVHEHEPPPFGLTERLREDEMKVQHRARREPFGEQRCVEALDREGTERIEQKIAQVRHRVQRDECPVTLKRLRTDPPGDVGEPVSEVLGDLDLRLVGYLDRVHGRRTLALVPSSGK